MKVEIKVWSYHSHELSGPVSYKTCIDVMEGSDLQAEIINNLKRHWGDETLPVKVICTLHASKKKCVLIQSGNLNLVCLARNIENAINAQIHTGEGCNNSNSGMPI